MENEGDSIDVEESYNAVLEKVEVYLSKIYAASTKKDIGYEDLSDDGDEEMSVEPGSSASNQRELQKMQAQSPAKKVHSKYAGVSWNKEAKKYRSQVSIPRNMKKDHKNKSLVYLGKYALAADAALAYDEGARLLKIPTKSNFATMKDYKNAKLRELDQTGTDVKDVISKSAISSTVKKFVSKQLPSSAISKRKSSSNFTGVAYVKSSRTYLAKFMHNRKPHLRK